jgi:N-acetylneuraminic acid mutarotase
MKIKTKISGRIIRTGAWAVFLSVAFVAASSAFDWPNKWYKSAVATVGYGSTAKSLSQPRAFSFAERVAYQRAIEDVYWRHRIWPKENAGSKPGLDSVMSQAQLENKVAAYLHNSVVLEDCCQHPITAEQLQTEMDRMARSTKQPELLRELFEALGNNPSVIAECLARPILAERLIADFSAQAQTRHVESPPAEALRAMSVATTLGQFVYTVPEIANPGDAPCTDQWGPTSTVNAPSGRLEHTAIWTGSEMIIWGGDDYGSYFNTGGRYNPSTDSWTTTSITNAPVGRSDHTAVWNGSEMIIWGGRYYDGINYHNLNTGGRYNPSTDSWTATSTTNAPSGRVGHTAIWSGSEMIVWGGTNFSSDFNTGGRYNPSTDTWTATNTIGAPSARWVHTAVWTESEMIIWGGGLYPSVNTGGRYNPSTDSWTATTMTNVPSGRSLHTAVWTGSEMIVWGGYGGPPIFDLNTGGRYDPSTDSWTATSNNNAPSARHGHTAVWTGRIMIVWSGDGGGNTGGRYDPDTNSWTATSTTYAPDGRTFYTAVWTGTEMIVWGGDAWNTGGRYCGQYPTPTPTPTSTPTPTPTPTAPPLTIIQPNGGEVWLMGSVHEINWNSPDLQQSDRVIIQYSRDGGASWFRIAQDVPALSHSYSWRVDNYPTTQGRVKILLQGNRSVTDQSDANFTVQRTPYMTLHRPNGGETFTIGQYINIHWSRQNPGANTVDVDYSIDNGTTWSRIASQTADTGWYSWNVPAPATTAAKVRIRYHETPSVTDTSEAVFTIVSP